MMLSPGKDHRVLVGLSFGVFLLLSLLVAVFPATTMQEDNAPLPGSSPLSEAAQRGLRIYIREGCVACHTQQVRNIEMDNVWGSRPSIPADYYYTKARMDVWRQSPSILGSERTGPDLTNVGQRIPSDTWHYMHLYNPRIVVPESIMPSYAWLFETKSKADGDDIVLNLPPSLKPADKVVVASDEAKDLVAYLLSLKQVELPVVERDFIPSRRKRKQESAAARGSASAAPSDQAALPDGAALFQANCAVCHQPDGRGLPGAFPPLAGSPIVTDENPEIMIRIVLEGYDARPEYATMQPFAELLTDEEIAAIVNFERSHWGNNASQVSADDVKKLRGSANLP
ncbi:MAG: cytochrome c [Cyclobacteriaceae bacterium]|jgi:cytochrome c oxidase cbb3-type subunit 2|nr:cytochrome c [Cyclobacteriaceae bacterium]